MNAPLSASIWADRPAPSRNENAPPQQGSVLSSAPKTFAFGTAATAANSPPAFKITPAVNATPSVNGTPPVASAPKSFVSGTQAVTTNASSSIHGTAPVNGTPSVVVTPSMTPRSPEKAPPVQSGDSAASPAPSNASSTSTRTEPRVTPVNPNLPLLHNPQQARLLLKDPDYLASRPQSRARGPAVGRSPNHGLGARPPPPRQVLSTPARSAATQRPSSNGFTQWGQTQQNQGPRESVTKASTVVPASKLNGAVPANPSTASSTASVSPSTTRELEGIKFNDTASSGGAPSGGFNETTAVKPTTFSEKPFLSGPNLFQNGINEAKEKMLAASNVAVKAARKTESVSTPSPATASIQAHAPTPSPAPEPLSSPTPFTAKANLSAATAEKQKVDAKDPQASGTATPKTTPPHLRAKAAKASSTIDDIEKSAAKLPNGEVKPVKIKAEEDTFPAPNPERASVASKPASTPMPTTVSTSMPTPAASPGNLAYATRLGEIVAKAKQNPAHVAMEMDALKEQLEIYEEMTKVAAEKKDLLVKRAEVLARIDTAIAAKDEHIDRCEATLAALKEMQKQEDEAAAKDMARLNGLKLEE